MQDSANNKKPSTGQFSLEAMIQYNASGYHRHRLRNICVGSAFVEMGNVRVLRQDSLVRVVFVHRDRGRSLTHRLEAKVTRVVNNGAFLIFVDLDEQAHQALSKLQDQAINPALNLTSGRGQNKVRANDTHFRHSIQ